MNRNLRIGTFNLRTIASRPIRPSGAIVDSAAFVGTIGLNFAWTWTAVEAAGTQPDIPSEDSDYRSNQCDLENPLSPIPNRGFLPLNLHMHRQSVFASITTVAARVRDGTRLHQQKRRSKLLPDSAATATAGKALRTDTPRSAGNSTAPPATLTAADQARVPNELGRIPGARIPPDTDHDALYSRERNHFRKDLEDIYARGYRPVTISQILDRKIDLPQGLSPDCLRFRRCFSRAVQLHRAEREARNRPAKRNRNLARFPEKASGLDEFSNVLHAARQLRQAMRFSATRVSRDKRASGASKKVQWLHEKGFELCNHTLWHANLAKYPDAFVQEQIARGQMAIDSAVPGYKVRTFALPLGVWPKNRALAKSGSWTDPKTHNVVRYNYEAILEVSGGPTKSRTTLSSTR